MKLLKKEYHIINFVIWYFFIHTRGYAVYVKDNDTSSKENSNADNNVTSNNNEILYKLMWQYN